MSFDDSIRRHNAVLPAPLHDGQAFVPANTIPACIGLGLVTRTQISALTRARRRQIFSSRPLLLLLGLNKQGPARTSYAERGLQNLAQTGCHWEQASQKVTLDRLAQCTTEQLNFLDDDNIVALVADNTPLGTITPHVFAFDELLCLSPKQHALLKRKYHAFFNGPLATPPKDKAKLLAFLTQAPEDLDCSPAIKNLIRLLSEDELPRLVALDNQQLLTLAQLSQRPRSCAAFTKWLRSDSADARHETNWHTLIAEVTALATRPNRRQRPAAQPKAPVQS